MEYRFSMKDIEEAKQYLDDYEEWREEAKKAEIHFTKYLTTFRQIMMYLKMLKKSITEVFFMSSMSNGRGKIKLFQRKNQK